MNDGEPVPDVPRDHEREPNAVVDWLRAIALGIRDTAKDVLDEGRRGAHEAQAEYWEKFDEKVKRRR